MKLTVILFVKKIQQGLISKEYVKTREQLRDNFTKALNRAWVDYLCNNLGMINIYVLYRVPILYIRDRLMIVKLREYLFSFLCFKLQ